MYKNSASTTRMVMDNNKITNQKDLFQIHYSTKLFIKLLVVVFIQLF